MLAAAVPTLDLAWTRRTWRARRRGLDLFGPNAEARLTKRFTLNATQQNTLHTALASAKVQQQGMREKETTLRTQLGTVSVKAGDEGGIERTAADLETLRQQQTAIHAKTLATIYGSLTPAQQAKFLPLMNRELGIPGPRPAGGPGGRGRSASNQRRSAGDGPRRNNSSPQSCTPSIATVHSEPRLCIPSHDCAFRATTAFPATTAFEPRHSHDAFPAATVHSEPRL